MPQSNLNQIGDLILALQGVVTVCATNTKEVHILFIKIKDKLWKTTPPIVVVAKVIETEMV